MSATGRPWRVHGKEPGRPAQADAQSPDRVERMAVRELEHLPWEAGTA